MCVGANQRQGETKQDCPTLIMVRLDHELVTWKAFTKCSKAFNKKQTKYYPHGPR